MTNPLTPLQSKIMAAIAERDGGSTAKQIAVDLGITSTRASQYLGEMFFAGHLDRDNIRRGTGKGSFEFQYRPKPPKVEAPSSQWQPPVRIAEPAIRERETT